MNAITSSEQLNELFSALSKAQGAIDNVVSDKTAYNFKYADLGSVIGAIREPFAQNGLSVVQMPFSATGEDGILRDGVSTRICHDSGQWIESRMLSPGGGQGKSAIQNMGSNITYMRRYMLAAMTGVTQVDDETKLMGNNQKKEKEPASKKRLVDAGFNKMLEAINSGGYSVLSATATYDLSPEQRIMVDIAHDKFVASQGVQDAS